MRRYKNLARKAILAYSASMKSSGTLLRTSANGLSYSKERLACLFIHTTLLSSCKVKYLKHNPAFAKPTSTLFL